MAIDIPATPGGTITISTDNAETRATVNAWLTAQGATVLSAATGNGYFVPEPVLTYNIVFPSVAGNYVIRNNGADFASGATTTGETSIEIRTNQYTDASNVTIYWAGAGFLDVVQPFTGMDITISAVDDSNSNINSTSPITPDNNWITSAVFANGIVTYTGVSSTGTFTQNETNAWWSQAKGYLGYVQATVAYRELADSNTTQLIRFISQGSTAVNDDHIRFVAAVAEQQIFTNLAEGGNLTSSISLDASQISFQTAGSYTSAQAQSDFSTAGLSTDNSTRAIIDEELDAGKLTRVGRPS